IVAGGANNQLAEARHGADVQERGILYAPDYVINAGGIINVYGELHDWSPERSKRKAGEIYHTILRVFALAEDEGIPTSEAADRLAEERIASTRELHRSLI
ncbi:MAG: leucine dehydrogenase, partial [Gemmatimonadetes bacterium]|nr:leucine dehydrogenase [Gemmatimonadota bacterium]NIR80076.1 leucine dehydrogenase [Gemmatimonadota bacterium]NIT88814.1 leucine dehydrogenase [Gemmatimonadota bacterium]NIU32618.1 leucine dehydrogenase [Gemmatimonadota bacterium]NIU37071.1 leucine dehydrogenase [Gemmatimonadota bacterium]